MKNSRPLFISFSLLFFMTLPSELINTKKLITKVFGPAGVNLPEKSLFFMENFLERLSRATDYQQMIACKKAATLLQAQIDVYERNEATVSSSE